MISRTSITSTKGVTLISEIDFLFYNSFQISYLNISLEIISIISSEKTSNLLEISSSIVLNLLKNKTEGIGVATKPKAVAKSASAIPGATSDQTCILRNTNCCKTIHNTPYCSKKADEGLCRANRCKKIETFLQC